MSRSVGVLFVCLGNICRSPTAEAVFTQLAEQAGILDRLIIDSAGTGAYHIGSAPDRRSQQAAQQRGYEMSHLKARQVQVVDFEKYDYVLAMDEENLANLQAIQPTKATAVVKLFLEYAEHQGKSISETEVPDPYYGGVSGFEHVLDLVEMASAGLLADIQKRFALA